MIRYLLPTILLICLVSPLSAAEPAATAENIRSALTKTLPLILKGSNGHRKQRTCFACHHQAIPLFALTAARSRGLSIPDGDVREHLQSIADFLGKNRDNYHKGLGQGGQVDTAGYALWTLETGGWKPDETTAAVAEYLLLRDKDLDHWRATSKRPPSEISSFTTTYLALRGLQTFGTAKQRQRIDERIRIVRGWLEKTPAQDTEDRVFRLGAMQRAGCAAEKVRAAAQELMEKQREDGGWAQRDEMKSDAYATGTALTGLHQAVGLATNDPIYQRGVKYLLATQLADGSWHVRSRSEPFQPYFESGFPHGKDQFISLAASSWAAMVLALALPPVERRAAQAPPPMAWFVTNSAPPSAAGAESKKTIEVEETEAYIQIDTDVLKARVRKKGYVSGVERASFLDKRSGARELGFGLHIMDFLLAPGWRDDGYPRTPEHHGNLPKHYVEGPQICTQAKELKSELVRGKDFVAVRLRYTFHKPGAGYKAGSIWEQTLVFQPGLRYFFSSEQITSVNDVDDLFYRVDMPGHVRHKGGDNFTQIYLSYLDKPILASEFREDFSPDAKFLYQRKAGKVPERMIRAYQVKLDDKPGPWLAGMTLDPAEVSEAWCHQRGYVCFIEELHGKKVKAGEKFGAAYIIGWFDDIPEMQRVYDRYRGKHAIAVERNKFHLK